MKKMASRSGSLGFHSEDTAGRCCIQRNTACQSVHLLLASHSAYSSVEPVKNKETNKETLLKLPDSPLEKRASQAAPSPARPSRRGGKPGNRQQQDPLARTLLTWTGNSQAYAKVFTRNTTTKFRRVSYLPPGLTGGREFQSVRTHTIVD